MYLARIISNGMVQYFLRESYQDGGNWLSRDLVALGSDPRTLIDYPGGNAFMVNEGLEKKLRALGVEYEYEELEHLLFPFVRPDIREIIERFARHRPLPRPSKEELARAERETHIFDRRRIYCLRYGGIDQSRIYKMPAKMYVKLLDKSRDELEQFFVREEAVLRPREWKQYVYVIFNLQRHFEQMVANIAPSALPPDQVDDLLVEEVCALQMDKTFWRGMQFTDNPHPYLIRYLIMYFDGVWPQRNIMNDYVRQFMDSRRQYRPPASHRVKMEEAGELFGVKWDELRKMRARDLTRLYRKRAHDLHPDKGGDAAKFAAMTDIYKRLMDRK